MKSKPRFAKVVTPKIAGAGFLKLCVAATFLAASHSLIAQVSDPHSSRPARLFVSQSMSHDLRRDFQDYFVASAQENGGISVIVELKLPETISLEDRSADKAKQRRFEALVSSTQQKFTALASAYLPDDPIYAVHPINGLPYVQVWADENFLRHLFQFPDVLSVGEEMEGTPALNETIPQIDAITAFNEGATGSGQVVAVLDTGVESSHLFFSSRIVAERCFSTPVPNFPVSLCSSVTDGEPLASSFIQYWHGTAMAGIIAGTSTPYSGVTLRGVAPSVQLISVKVYHQIACTGTPPTTTCASIRESDLANAMMYVQSLASAGTYRISAVNISSSFGANSNGVLVPPVGTPAACDSAYPLSRDAVNSLAASHIAVVAASGDNGHVVANPYNVMYPPACLTNAISVAAVDKSNNFAGYSNVSSSLSLFAPGGCDSTITPVPSNCGVLSSLPGNSFGRLDPDAGALFNQPLSGTSQSAAHVSGAIAAMRSLSTSTTVIAPPPAILSRLNATGNAPNPALLPAQVANVKVLDLGRAAAPIAVTPSAGPNGAISPSTAQSIKFYNVAQFTVTPNAGFIPTVAGTCGGSLAGAVYTTNPITGPCTVTATFSLSPAIKAATEIVLADDCDATDPHCPH